MTWTTNQWLADLQAAMRALWPDRPKVYFQATLDMDTPVLTVEEQGQLTRVAQAIAAQREQMGAQMAEAEEGAVYDFLQWLATYNIVLREAYPEGADLVLKPVASGPLLERWKTERREG